VTVSSAIVVFGLLSTTTLISINVNSAYFELYSFIVQNLPASNISSGYDYDVDNNNSNTHKDKNTVSVVGNDWVISGFSWIPKYIYGKGHDFNKFYTRIEYEKVILVIDKRFNNTIMNIKDGGVREADMNQKNLAELRNIYNKSDVVAKFNSKNTERYNFDKYPYYSMRDNREIGRIEVRMNY
jgi:hypothetical protein